jgi:hypothetical protein
VRLTYTSRDGEEVIPFYSSGSLNKHTCRCLCAVVCRFSLMQYWALVDAGIPWDSHCLGDIHSNQRRNAEDHI